MNGSELSKCLLCPVCGRVPEVRRTETGAFMLICERHGIMMGGENMASAVVNWNKVVQFFATVGSEIIRRPGMTRAEAAIFNAKFSIDRLEVLA